MGIRAFVDQRGLRAAADADTEMMLALRTAPVGLALLSAAFLDVSRSPWPLCELRMIAESNKLLPVVCQDIQHNDLRDRLTAGLTEAYTLGQQAQNSGGLIAVGLQFSTPGQRHDLVRRVTRTTALSCSGKLLDHDCDAVCWAVLRKLADHAIGSQRVVNASNRRRFLRRARSLEVAMTRVTLRAALAHLPDYEVQEAHTYLLDLRQILDEHRSRV